MPRAAEGPGVFLTDFGLAKNVATGSRYTRTGETLGTPAYMSPEQARGELAALTAASDVWALGCVLYELLSGGRAAFHGETPAAIVGAVLTHEPAALRTMPPGVRRVLRHCLQKSSARRYASAASLREDCHRLLGGRRPQAPALHRPARARWMAGVAATAAVLALATWVATRWGTATGPAAAAGDASSLAERAWRLRRSDPAQAEGLLRRALAREPRRQDWRLRLGLLRWMRAGTDAALAEWELIPDTAPESTRAWWLRGVALVARGVERHDRTDLKAGQSAWRRAAQGTGPPARWARTNDVFARSGLDAARAHLGIPRDWTAALVRGLFECSVLPADGAPDTEAGIAALSRAIEQGVPLATAHTLRARLRERVGDLQGARADLDRALAIRPERSSTLVERARVRQLLSDVAGARADLDAAIALDPLDAGGYLARGVLHLDCDDVPAALRDLDRAVENGPRLAPAYYNRAVARDRAGNLAGAESDYDQAIALAPADADSIFNRAKLRSRRGALADAEQDYDRVLDLQPDRVTALVSRGVTRHRRGNDDGAMADWDAALARDPRCVNALLNRADTWAHREAWSKAFADYDRAVAADPTHAQTYVQRGALYLDRGDVTRARADLDHAVALDPQHVAARYERALLRRETGDAQGAVTDLQAVLRRQSNHFRAHLVLALIYRDRGDWYNAAVGFQNFLQFAPSGNAGTAAARKSLAECKRRLRRGGG